MSTHTPGPWRTAVVGGFHDNKLVASAWIEAGEYHSLATLMPVKEVEANARLMAAAPDLLAACLDAYEEISMLVSAVVDPQTDTVRGRLRAAIAKAEGRN